MATLKQSKRARLISELVNLEVTAYRKKIKL
jgi:hypothetical protein